MNYEKSNKFDKAFMLENMMGPNCAKLLEYLSAHMTLKPDMRVLDLGCGRGITSILLAREFGATVFATDLWIPTTENYGRFKAFGLDERVVPIHAEAHDLPYADEYFDVAVCVDAYLYFGQEEGYMDDHLATLVKPGGEIGLVIPGVKMDLDGVPEDIAPYVSAEDFGTFKSIGWWQRHLEVSKRFRLERIWEFPDFDEAWTDWLASDNPYAVHDRDMIRTNAGRYMNLICVIGRRV